MTGHSVYECGTRARDARHCCALPEEPHSLTQDFMNPAEGHLKGLLLSPAGWLAATSYVALWLVPSFMAFLSLPPKCNRRFLLATKSAGSSGQYGSCWIFTCSGAEDKGWREAGNHDPCVGELLALASHQSNSLVLRNHIQISNLCPQGKYNRNVFATVNYHPPGHWTWNLVERSSKLWWQLSLFSYKLSDVNTVDLPRKSENQTNIQPHLPDMKYVVPSHSTAEEGWAEECLCFPFTSLFLYCWYWF